MWLDTGERGRVHEALVSYGISSHEREAERVQLAILKLSEGQAEKALAMVAAAKQDYRDVLMWAEYPEQARTPLAVHRDLSKAEKQQLAQSRRKDRKQYEDWLKKPGK